MGTTYFRRFRMDIDLTRVSLPQPELPEDYRWLPWQTRLLQRHSLTKYNCFRSEIDSQVFPSLGDYMGCWRLMREITRQRSFLASATWLLTYAPPRLTEREWMDCGTIQGLKQSVQTGAIQNVGITPVHRGLGLGRALVLKALWGFRQARVQRVYLEVTADNEPAVNLYYSLGFQLVRTMYRSAETPPLEEPSAPVF